MSASHASIHHPAMHETKQHDAPDIGAILDRGKIDLGHQTTSKKRLLEQIANMFAERIPDADARQIFSTLFERENLGSTGIGSGVALPHGRIAGLKDVAGIFLRLNDELDFDAVDHLPVNLVFAILVPEDATDEHLNLLACLAGIFRDDEKRKKLLDTRDTALIRETFARPDNCEGHY
ncbi:MAG: PTS sugar transporter subunit IIA [Pseudomonadota bacterium]|nr:PTS sugar transporter subunit IIA [Pseudomonadota bacterium]